jgi:hypothetical protein
MRNVGMQISFRFSVIGFFLLLSFLQKKVHDRGLAGSPQGIANVAWGYAKSGVAAPSLMARPFLALASLSPSLSLSLSLNQSIALEYIFSVAAKK